MQSINDWIKSCRLYYVKYNTPRDVVKIEPKNRAERDRQTVCKAAEQQRLLKNKYKIKNSTGFFEKDLVEYSL